MSLTHEVTVWCDGESCAQWEQATTSAKILRKDLRKKGWGNAGKHDLCPVCYTLEKRNRKNCEELP